MRAQSCLTLCDPMDCSRARLLCPWDSPWGMGGGAVREEEAGRAGAIMQKIKG